MWYSENISLGIWSNNLRLETYNNGKGKFENQKDVYFFLTLFQLQFNISIIDINNQVPQIDIFEQQVSIWENATTGQYVGQIKAYDNDRDSAFWVRLKNIYINIWYSIHIISVPHNTLEYAINSAFTNLHNLLQINITTGEVYVNLRNGYILDRDMGTTYHYVPIDIKDNFNFLNAVNGRK